MDTNHNGRSMKILSVCRIANISFSASKYKTNIQEADNFSFQNKLKGFLYPKLKSRHVTYGRTHNYPSIVDRSEVTKCKEGPDDCTLINSIERRICMNNVLNCSVII